MKRLAILILFFAIGQLAYAQPLLLNGEYFIDNDPGLGNATPFSIPSGTDISTNLSIPVSGLSNNLHNLYVRVQDVNRTWSVTTVKPFLKITASNNDLVEAEYFIDSDPGFGNAVGIPIVADTILDITAPIDLTSVSSGLHVLYVRVKNGQGFWSLTEIRPFFKVESSNTPITDIEYFWDIDPGEGNATQVTGFTQTNDVSHVFNINLATLPDGFHNLYVRVKNQNNFWSLTSIRPFLKVTDPSSNIAGIEYFWDNDPGEGLGTPVTFTADSNVLVVFPADLSSIPDGFHNFYIRVQNQQGLWSLTNIRPVFKVSDANSNIAAMEYFIDTDPGFGQGTPITLDSIRTDIVQNTLIDLTNVSGGLHVLYVRAQNADGLWSLTHNKPFLKASGGADLVRIEYFFNNEPGHGNGNTITLDPTQDTTWTGVIDISALPNDYHDIYVRVQDADGSYSLTHTERFAFCNGPQINIGTLTDTICLGAAITVWDSTTNLNATTKYDWDWESDGVVDDTTIGSVTHTYLDTGTYFLTLVATSFDTCFDSTAIRIVVLPPPVAEFVADTACRTFLTSFADSSFTVLPTAYSWDFDNDFVADSTTVGDVQHVYPSAGVFPTNLIIDMGYNCIDTFSADVVVKEQPVPIYIAPGNCLGETTDLVDASTNLLPGATYAWDVQPDSIVDNTTTGTISLIYPDTGTFRPQLIIDNLNGCIDTFSRDLIIHDLPVLSTTQTSPTCFGGFDGQATVNVFGDVSKYTFRWSDEDNQTTAIADSLYARTYFVAVVDSNGCYNRDTVEVINPPLIDLSVVTTNTQCGQSNGSATLTINSGVAPFDIYWTNGERSLFIDNLSAGIYIASVRDTQGCENIIPAFINDSNAPVGTVNKETDVTCFGLEDGAIDIDVTGGATPYTFEWSNQDTTEDIINLAPGPYELTIIGADSCISFVQGVVEEPAKLLVDVEGFESFCGLPTGSALANVSGGSGSVTYNWSSGGTASLEQNLDAGVYTVDVTDTNNCVETGYVAISDTGSADIFVDSLVNVTCGLQDGGMYIKVLRVRGEPDFLWNNGDTTEDLINVNVGLHFVQVADSNNCKAFEFGVLDYIAPIPNPICLITTDTLDSAANTEAIFLVWEKLNNPAVESYNVWKESTASGIYQRIGNVKKTDPGIYVDSFSSITSRWWRYKITVVDSCGNESDINARAASAHKTINLNSTYLGNDSVLLNWDRYIGFQFNRYLIYRLTDVDGYTWVDTIPANQTSYIDIIPSNADTVFYFVFAENAFECDPNKDEDFSRTRSNPTSLVPDRTALAWIPLRDRIKVYPNPASDRIYIDHPEENSIQEIRVNDVNSNTVIRTDKYKPKKGLNIDKLSSGVYFVRIQMADKVIMKKVIKE